MVGCLLVVIERSQTRVCANLEVTVWLSDWASIQIVPLMDGIAQQIPTLCESSNRSCFIHCLRVLSQGRIRQTMGRGCY